MIIGKETSKQYLCTAHTIFFLRYPPHTNRAVSLTRPTLDNCSDLDIERYYEKKKLIHVWVRLPNPVNVPSKRQFQFSALGSVRTSGPHVWSAQLKSTMLSAYLRPSVSVLRKWPNDPLLCAPYLQETTRRGWPSDDVLALWVTPTAGSHGLEGLG